MKKLLLFIVFIVFASCGSYNNDVYYNSSYPSSGYSSGYSSGTVHVKGYYRKNGTYVQPYTRRAPRR
ncbi:MULTISPECIES: hypothetical protein [Elizabethkingia]|uniref:hypothetical protein n=1 Tax=Elizabethkingia TaxID=308865 RepID=UPI000D526B00|nr:MULTISPECIES: hypothetical protein [Elizabethkingia]MCT4263385.1 hypothetical protein [Elizabethkingia anophelis]QCO45802.1 hypothetical protein FCS00_05240 [Elizabethkingia sp. 2-6]WQM37658.1 hypothetical protein U2S95_14960 [Elizabethkingia miricola]